MEINVHHDKKTVDIWLTRAEAADNALRESLKTMYKKYADMEYFVAVFESGTEDLLEGMAALLQYNLVLKARNELKLECGASQEIRKKPMQKRFFTSDLHFGHENVLRFDDRKFKDVDEMDAELIRRWNAKVGKGDIVYVLGDMIWKTRNGVAEDLIKSLNGQIILIKGNHDRFLHNAAAKNALAGVKDYEDISVTLEDGTVRRCILSHYFMPFYIGHRHNAIHLHGHSHNTEEHLHELEIAELLRQKGYTPRIVNVGCMHWNYEPVTLDEILAKYPM